MFSGKRSNWICTWKKDGRKVELQGCSLSHLTPFGFNILSVKLKDVTFTVNILLWFDILRLKTVERLREPNVKCGYRCNLYIGNTKGDTYLMDISYPYFHIFMSKDIFISLWAISVCKNRSVLQVNNTV